MAGVDGAALGVIEAGSPVHIHVFQHALKLRLHVVAENLLHALGGPLVVEGPALRVHPAQGAGDVEDNHRHAEGTAGAGFRNGLWPQAGGVGHAVVQVPVKVVGPAGPQEVLLPPGYAVILGVGQGVKGLGVAVAALTQRLSLPGDGEVHPAPGVVVDAVLLQKVQAAFGGLQPLRPGAVGVAEAGEHPPAPPLHPDAFIGGVNLPLSVQTGVDAPVLPVHAVVQPEADAPLQFLPHPGLGRLQNSLLIHDRNTPFHPYILGYK